MDVVALAARVGELERVTYAQGVEIYRLHERLAAAADGLLVLEARLMLVTGVMDRWSEHFDDAAA